jgi:hypothetical protein
MNDDECQTKWNRFRNGMDGDKCRMKRNGFRNGMDGDCDGSCVDNGIVEQSASMSCAMMAYKTEERVFFLLLHVFFFFYNYFSSCKVTIRATHYMITSSKTHRSAQPRC